MASNIPNHLELIEDSVNGFIIHNSIVSIKDKLNDLKSDFSKLKIISDNAVDNAESEYGIDTLINNLEKIILISLINQDIFLSDFKYISKNKASISYERSFLILLNSVVSQQIYLHQG